jgi:hypothetical protein
MTAAEDLQQDLDAVVNSSDDEAWRDTSRVASPRTVVSRSSRSTSSRRCWRFGTPDPPAGYRFVSAADIDEVDLRILDDVLRATYRNAMAG